MHLLDLALVIWLVAGTFAIKAMLRSVHRGTLARGLFVTAVVPLAGLPLLSLKLELFEYSAIAVVAAAISLFWFSILLARMDSAA